MDFIEAIIRQIIAEYEAMNRIGEDTLSTEDDNATAVVRAAQAAQTASAAGRTVAATVAADDQTAEATLNNATSQASINDSNVPLAKAPAAAETTAANSVLPLYALSALAGMMIIIAALKKKRAIN